jgi:hypothetical protein
MGSKVETGREARQWLNLSGDVSTVLADSMQVKLLAWPR